MNKIIVNDKKTLKELYDDSSFTIEGLDPSDSSIQELFDWIKKYTPLKEERAYVISGSLMNMAYGLTGDNAYPEEDCSLVAIKLSDIENVEKIITERFKIGGRWFDDIVTNNNAREQQKKK